MCGGHHDSGGAPSCCCNCGCHSQHGRGGGHPFRFHRWFSTRDEEAAALEEYLKGLEAEAKGVRERVEELRRTSEEAR